MGLLTKTFYTLTFIVQVFLNSGMMESFGAVLIWCGPYIIMWTILKLKRVAPDWIVWTLTALAVVWQTVALSLVLDMPKVVLMSPIISLAQAFLADPNH